MPMSPWVQPLLASVSQLAVVSGDPPPVPTGPGAHLHWRILCESAANSTYYGIRDLQFRETVGGADAATGGTPISGADRGVGKTAAEAFDDPSGISYWGADKSAGAANTWIGYTFASAVKVLQVQLLSRNDSFYDQTPREWRLQYSDDLVTWHDVMAVGREDPWTQNVARTYDVPLFALVNPLQLLTSGDSFYADFSNRPYTSALKNSFASDGDNLYGVEDMSLDQNDATGGGGNPPWDETEGAAHFVNPDYLVLENGYTLSDTGQTIAARVKFDAATPGTQCIFGAINAPPFDRGWLSVTDGVASMGVGQDASNIHKDDNLTDLRGDGNYHVLAAVWDGTEGRLFLDGSLVHSFTRTTGAASTTSAILGARATSGGRDLHLTGKVSHVFVDARKLTDQEVADLSTAWAT